jgi:hypothetical protein
MLLSAPGIDPERSVWLAVGVALLSPRLWLFQKPRFSSLCGSSVSEYSVAVECDLNEADGDMVGFRVAPEFREEIPSLLYDCSISFEPVGCWECGIEVWGSGEVGPSNPPGGPVKECVELCALGLELFGPWRGFFCNLLGLRPSFFSSLDGETFDSICVKVLTAGAGSMEGPLSIGPSTNSDFSRNGEI